MTEQTKIRAHEKRFPLDRLVLSPLNPRQVVSQAEIEELAESIWEAGLIQPLAGYQIKGNKAEIVGGGRRLRALQFLAQKHENLAKDRPELTNPLVNLAQDIEQAQVWATTENVARKALHPAHEIRAYGQLAAKNFSVEKIARMFAVTDAHVRRRLALANLPSAIIDALEANEINLTAAGCFTISNDEKHSLAVLERVKEGRFSEYSLRNALKPDSVSGSDRRVVFVGQDEYTKAGGKITQDLFAEETLFDDAELLQSLFEAKLQTTVEEIKDQQGWNWVKGVGDRSYVCSYSMGLEKFGRVYPEEGALDEEQAARYTVLSEASEMDDLLPDVAEELKELQKILDGDYTAAQKDFSGAYVCIGNDGQISVSGGFIKPETKKAAIVAGVLTKSSHGEAQDKMKSPFSKALAEDLARIACGARQNAIIDKPDLLIALLAYQLTHSLFWQSPFGISTSAVPNQPTTETEGYMPDERIFLHPKPDMTSKDLGKSFRAFLNKGGKHATSELLRALAAKYQGGSEELQAMIDKETLPDIRSVWTPTKENFFKRVGGPYMIDLWCDLLEIGPDHPTALAFAKKKKAEKADEMDQLFRNAEHRAALGVSDNQAARIASWLPEEMA